LLRLTKTSFMEFWKQSISGCEIIRLVSSAKSTGWDWELTRTKTRRRNGMYIDSILFYCSVWITPHLDPFIFKHMKQNILITTINNVNLFIVVQYFLVLRVTENLTWIPVCPCADQWPNSSIYDIYKHNTGSRAVPEVSYNYDTKSRYCSPKYLFICVVSPLPSILLFRLAKWLFVLGRLTFFIAFNDTSSTVRILFTT
jgi:hypothetical protein